jgi:alkylation response protein AidB-like acyl-CoA dehydrogenase
MFVNIPREPSPAHGGVGVIHHTAGSSPVACPHQAAAMDFDPEVFRHRCSTWFAANYEPVDPERDDPPGLVPHTTIDHTAPLRAAQGYQRGLWDAGLAGLCVAPAFGGQGLPLEAESVFHEVAAAYAIPSMIPLSVGISLAVPTMIQFGSERLTVERVPKALCADEVWCQMFSEPDAGSDLASLRTRAERVGDGYVVTGQKVWTSFAQHSAYGLLLARTGTQESRHRGLALFAVPMDLPGIRVRPLREMTGGTHFNEVYLDDVHVPAGCLLGEDGGGWAAAMFTLGNERNLAQQRARPKWKRVLELARHTGVASDPVVRSRITDLAVREEVARMMAQGPRGVPASLSKLMSARLEQLASRTAIDVLGALALAHEPADELAAAATHWFLGARANTIAGGTDEIQMNILGERVLGLPRAELAG